MTVSLQRNSSWRTPQSVSSLATENLLGGKNLLDPIPDTFLSQIINSYGIDKLLLNRVDEFTFDKHEPVGYHKSN
jgi:hypothetical protein